MKRTQNVEQLLQIAENEHLEQSDDMQNDVIRGHWLELRLATEGFGAIQTYRSRNPQIRVFGPIPIKQENRPLPTIRHGYLTCFFRNPAMARCYPHEN